MRRAGAQTLRSPGFLHLHAMPLDLSQLPPLPARPADSHKGTFGTVLVVGGCDDGVHTMIGAPALAAVAALRAGCGLAKLAVPAPIIAQAITIAPSATGIPLPVDEGLKLRASDAAALLAPEVERATCLTVGPGWGVGFDRQQLLIWLLAQDEVPVVLDADGLNNLASIRDFTADLRAPLIITPHPGEFARLAKALNLGDAADDEAQRTAAAMNMAQRLGCVVVLKGSTTIVTDGHQSWGASSPNAALATAGTGDVLTGTIASAVAQWWKPHLGRVTPNQMGGLDLFDAARWGVALHSLAGQRWSDHHGSAGLLAHELADQLPEVLRSLRESKT